MKLTMMHGAGGELMDELIKNVILRNLTLKSAGSVTLEALDDGASIDVAGEHFIFTIDGHTVKPLFFPGGDIGRLALSGTVNDLVVMGAKPLAIATSLIIQEGFDTQTLEKILHSMDTVSREVPVPIITGDTKVVEDKIGIFVITAGVGRAEKIIRDSGAREGDAILINGGIGEHGFAILSLREGISLDTTLKSDVSPVWKCVKSVAQEIGWENIHAMKDPTRGGLSEALNEIAQKSKVGIKIWESKVPMREEVHAMGEMLGISPFHMANEGKVVFSVSKKYAEDALTAMRRAGYVQAAMIGEVIQEYTGKVVVETEVGGRRFMERPVGDPVPRVC